MGLGYDPQIHARELAIDIHFTSQLPHGWRGAYDLTDRCIYLARGMSLREARSTLTHEIAHHLAGDCASDIPVVSARQEHRADLYAARMLIDLDEYRKAEIIHGGNMTLIAHDLHVTRRVVYIWQSFIASSLIPHRSQSL